MGKSTNVLLAGAVGFIAGILFAPKSGKETREEISGKVDQARSAAMDGVDSFRSSAKNVADEVTGMAKSVRSSADNVVEEASQLGEEAKARSNRVTEEAKRTARTVKNDVDRNVR